MRIAHCSDLHLLSLAGARALDFANKRWIGGLNLLANRGRHYHSRVFEAMVADFNRSAIDHILVTGDVTNLAFEEEFRFARRLFEAIRLGPEHVTVLPGNHDAYVARGAEYFSTHFEDYNRPDPGWAWSDEAAKAGKAGKVADRWPVVRVRGPLALLALSTSLATPWFTAWGRVGDEQLDRLAAALADPRLAGRFRLVAIHHPPAGERSRSAVRGLRDRDRFAAVIAEAGAELILHGHEHLDLRAELPGPPGGGPPIAVRGIQSGTYEAGNPVRRARYRVYEIGEQRAGASAAGRRPALVGETLRVWDPERGEFATDEASTGGEAAA
ncbi:MAG TPA: metallophosphoesterase [Candidatus Acidoferrum sp.]|nr:metallophosphoesterase [Candidatus Acidoferrum sp.]